MKKIHRLLLFLSMFVLVPAFGQLRTDTIHVVHYTIQLSIMDFTNRQINGSAELQVVAKMDGVSKINLDLMSLTVDSVKINEQHQIFTHYGERFSVLLSEDANSGDTLPVKVYYHGVPPKDPSWGGFYFSGQYAFNLGVGFTSVPHNFGRVWFPCLDEFTDKSTYTFSIRTESSKMAICGGILTDTEHLPDNSVIWNWEISVPIPTYLASVAVGNYQLYEDVYQGIENDIPIAIYAPPSYINNVENSFIHLKEILQIFEEHYGPYRWDRVGYVLVNFSGGAMEHAMNIAYPQFAVNGNLTYQSLYAHELAHSWFGNLITCSRAEEMWINEGFARYSEALVDEVLYPDENPYLDGYLCNIRALHAAVLRYAHEDDGGYYALNNVPQNTTYGSTSYDKGALVVYTLRNYMGDSLFFHSLQALLEQYKFSYLNSNELFDFLSVQSGVDLIPFYNAWVNQSGFLHFSIDSIRPIGEDHFSVYVRQKLHQASYFGTNNKIDITLFDNTGRTETYPFEFSGEYGIATIEFEGTPLFGVIDYYEKMSDAVLDYNHQFTQPGNFISEEAAFVGTISRMDSSVWMRVEHHFVEPDSLKAPNDNIIRISDNHYWRVEYITGDEVAGQLSFKYKADTDNGLDKELFSGGYTSADLLLLYRRDASEDWQIIPSTLQGTLSGMIKSTILRPGEYTLGIGDRSAVGAIPDLPKPSIEIYPNPATDSFTVISPDNSQYSRYIFYDTQGKIIRRGEIAYQNTTISTLGLARGNYVLKIYSASDGNEFTRKIILQ